MPQGAIGELLIKGPNITPGYWNKPEATAAAFTDGWLHTGDAARLDDEGFVYIVDRWKDMYISGGENVYPAEVENVLFQLPQVADAAIIGVPNERWGEVGMAIIVRKPDQPLEEGDVIRHCLGQPRQVQGAAVGDLRRRPAAQRHRQGAEARAADAVRRHDRAGDQLRL